MLQQQFISLISKDKMSHIRHASNPEGFASFRSSRFVSLYHQPTASSYYFRNMKDARAFIKKNYEKEKNCPFSCCDKPRDFSEIKEEYEIIKCHFEKVRK
jgi:hypothetical protein